jgi:hypothetical protein
MAISDHVRSLTLVTAPDGDDREIDIPAAELAAADLLVALGVDLEDAQLGACSLDPIPLAVHAPSVAVPWLVRDDPRARQEFLALTTGRHP